MTIGKEIYAVINPETGEILGDGSATAISGMRELLEGDLRVIKRVSNCRNAKIVKCKLVICDEEC